MSIIPPMKNLVLRVGVIVGGALVTACSLIDGEQSAPSYAEMWQQQQMNEQRSRIANDFAKWQQALAVTVRAEFSRVRGDCCCTGAELEPLKTVKVGKAEFGELMSILQQAEAPPAVDMDVYAPMSRAPQSADTHHPVHVVGPPFIINDALRLYDATGKCVFELKLYTSIGRKSDVPQLRRQDRERFTTHLILPDAEVDKFLNLPSYQAFVKQRKDAFSKNNEPRMRKDVRNGKATEEDIELCRPHAEDILLKPKKSTP